MPRLRSVRARIIVTFSLLMLLLVGISLIPVFFRPQTAQVNVDADAVKKASATAAALADIDTELTLQLEVLRIFPVTKDWSFADTYRSSVARVEASVQEAKDLQGDSADPQTLATLDDITRRANSIGLAGDAVFVFTDVSDTEQATETSSRIEGEVAELRPMVADLISEQQRQMDVALASTAGGGGGGAGLPLWALLGSAGLVLVVGVWLALALSRSILRPLAALQADAHSIARGETTTMAHISGPTEFESLAKNLNRMIVALLAKETAETGVSESETRYRQLAERMADLVFRVDIQKGLTYANPVWEKVTGFTLEDLASGPEIVGRLVHPEHWQSFIALCKGMLSGNMPEGPLALKCLRKDGQTIWLTFSFVPTYHEDGRLAAIEGIARDTTMLSHLVKEVRQRDDQLRLFISLSNAVATAIGFEEATDRALEAVLELLPRAEAGFLMAYNRHRDLLELHAVRGLDQKIMSKLVVKPGENLIGKAFETGEPDLYSSIKELTAPAGLGPESGNLLKQAAAESGLPQSIMCAPLGIGERPFGCLVLVAFSEGSFQTSDLDLLQAAAAQVALPLENAQLRAETDLKAITDGLTGL
ncbi:MAG: GAF domain-containing protein [Dehalococcoidia bacterium]|nr:GAF domain-containing protein [Dehalococcoidia bacterium]